MWTPGIDGEIIRRVYGCCANDETMEIAGVSQVEFMVNDPESVMS